MCVIEVTPEIETRRLRLRSPLPADAARLAELAAHPDIARQTCNMPAPYGPGDAEAFVARVQGHDPREAATFLIEHEDEGLVGVLGFSDALDGVGPWREVGYWIGWPFQGRGLATEALHGALDWAARRWRRRAIKAGHFVDNPASGRVLAKAGFLYTGEVIGLFSRARGAEVQTRRMVWLA